MCIKLKFSAAVDNNKIKGSGTVEQTKNTAFVYSDQVPDGKEASVDFHGLIDFQKIEKNKAGDPVRIAENNYEITWTILINQDHKQTVGGQTIYDWVETSSRPFMWFTGSGITIEVTYENGTSETRALTWNDLTTQTNNSRIYAWSYETPESDGKAAYLITGKTFVDSSDAFGNLTVSNGTQILLNYTSANATIENTGSGSVTPLKKVITDSDTYTEWEISVSVPAGGLPDFRIIDELPHLIGSGNTFIDNLIPDSLTVNGLIGDESYTYELNDNTRFYYLNFYKDRMHTQTGLLPTEDGRDRTIVVRFRTAVNQDWLDLAVGSGYSQFILHRNSATVRVNDFQVIVTADAIPVRQVIEKNLIETATVEIDGKTYPVFRYTLTLMGVVGDNAVIEDRFDTTFFKYFTAEGIRILGGDTLTPTDPNGSITAADTGSGLKITVNSFPKKTNGQLYKVYKIFFSLIPKDEETLKELNRVTAETGEYKLTDFAVWNNLTSNEVIAVYNYYPYVDKDLIGHPSSENGFVAEFRTIINKYAEDLDPESDILTIQDELSPNLRFIQDSISIDPHISSITIQYDEPSNTITFDNVPDETRFVITYRARVLGYGEVPYSNTIKFGRCEKKIEELVIIESSGSGSASNPSITIVKRDAKDLSVMLAGASFQLSYMTETGLVPVLDNAENPVIFTTGPDGSVLIIGNMNTLGWTLWKERTYCLIETASPLGYEPNPAPTCFILSDFPLSQLEYDITGDTLNIQNKPILISIPVIKQWNGQKLSSVTINLFADGVLIHSVELNEENGWQHRFVRLPKYDQADGHEIQYSVEEAPISGYFPEYEETAENGIIIRNSYIWTATPTQTSTAAPTFTPTAEPTETVIPTVTPTAVPTETVIPTHTPTAEHTPTVTPTFIPTYTVTSTVKPPRPPFFERKEELPRTGILGNGFSPTQPLSVNYDPLRMEMEIPALNIICDIVAVEYRNGEYPVEWLGMDAGVLADSAMPGQGNSVIVGHYTLNDTEYGPFALIASLEAGDRFFIHLRNHELMIFEVYANKKIDGYDIESLYQIASGFPSTITLLTCEDERITGGYASRRIIAAREISK